MALKDLIVDEKEMTEDVLQKTLEPYVHFSQEGKVLMNKDFRALPVRKQILVYLAAKKAWDLISGQKTGGYVSNSELQQTLNVPGGTLRPRIKEMRDGGFIVSREGRHTISDTAPDYILGGSSGEE